MKKYIYVVSGLLVLYAGLQILTAFLYLNGFSSLLGSRKTVLEFISYGGCLWGLFGGRRWAWWIMLISTLYHSAGSIFGAVILVREGYVSELGARFFLILGFMGATLLAVAVVLLLPGTRAYVFNRNGEQADSSDQLAGD